MNALLVNPFQDFNSAGVKPSPAEPVAASPTPLDVSATGVNSYDCPKCGERCTCFAPFESSSCGSFESLSDTPSGVVQLRAASLDMPGPQDSIPESASSNPCPDKIGADTSEGAASFPVPSVFFTHNTNFIPELLAMLNRSGHHVDLDALAENLDKIDSSVDLYAKRAKLYPDLDETPQPELLTFLRREPPPIYWPVVERKPQPKFLRKIFELAGVPS